MAGKRIKALKAQVDKTKKYSIQEVLDFVKSNSSKSFDETVDLAIQLGVDAKKSDQTVRGATVLPNGTGKSVKVAVFAQGEKAEEAKAAGADVVGFEDLAEEIKKGNFDFDVVIAAPDAMRVVGQLGTILGPKGLMPNPKVGTVTPDVATAVKNNKSGQAMYRIDKAGIIHTVIGKASFTAEALTENLQVLLTDLGKKKPATSKGKFIKKISISSTMGPGMVVDQSSLEG
ncbi:50S ribosomal protein L1 [Marinicella litoralis]|uniref:Large ribosomal subunit protein uL1 n=1 Tax=Marinicella litoralis TaxID=644220 RepID=A0A4R6XPZ5_9GAMM|nr:50S ribosomal protein L1 [Marinicella litoralis]TDR19423.1 LSU ribosomal protein L1P [Marinicella litoralis]